MSREITDLPIFEYGWEEDVISGQYVSRCAAFAREHGPIFRFQVRHTAIYGVHMVGPEANRFVFHTHRQHFSHEKGWTPIVGELVGRGLLNMDDPDHAQHRSLWNPAFASEVMEGYIPVVHQIIRETLQRWSSEPEVMVHKESQAITFDVAAAALAGITQPEHLAKLRHIFWVILHGLDGESDITVFEQIDQLQQELLSLLLGTIQARRRTPPNRDGPVSDVLSQIVHARFEDGRQLDDIEILGHLNVLLLAGHETTTSLSAWILYLLATMPEHWDELQQEVDEVLADIAIGDEAKVPTTAQIRKLVRIDNFIKEVGRVYPPVFQVPRVTLSACEFNGVEIPAETRVRLQLAAAHQLPDVFQDPLTFDPARFERPRREDRATPYSLVTFGGGPRICIGISFATIEVKVLAAQVLRHYRLSAPVNQTLLHCGHYNAVPKFDLRVAFGKR
ncbi:MAG: cytochrome P450 [Chloroflexota bacterium]